MILLFPSENSDHVCLLPGDGWVLDAASKMGCSFSKKRLEVKCTSSSWEQGVKIQQLFYLYSKAWWSWVSHSLDQSTPWLPFYPHTSVFFCWKPQHWSKEGSRHCRFPAWRQNTSRATGMAFHHLDKTPVLRNSISPVWKAI